MSKIRPFGPLEELFRSNFRTRLAARGKPRPVESHILALYRSARLQLLQELLFDMQEYRGRLDPNVVNAVIEAVYSKNVDSLRSILRGMEIPERLMELLSSYDLSRSTMTMLLMFSEKQDYSGSRRLILEAHTSKEEVREYASSPESRNAILRSIDFWEDQLTRLAKDSYGINNYRLVVYMVSAKESIGLMDEVKEIVVPDIGAAQESEATFLARLIASISPWIRSGSVEKGLTSKDTLSFVRGRLRASLDTILIAWKQMQDEGVPPDERHMFVTPEFIAYFVSAPILFHYMKNSFIINNWVRGTIRAIHLPSLQEHVAMRLAGRRGSFSDLVLDLRVEENRRDLINSIIAKTVETFVLSMLMAARESPLFLKLLGDFLPDYWYRLWVAGGLVDPVMPNLFPFYVDARREKPVLFMNPYYIMWVLGWPFTSKEYNLVAGENEWVEPVVFRPGDRSVYEFQRSFKYSASSPRSVEVLEPGEWMPAFRQSVRVTDAGALPSNVIFRAAPELGPDEEFVFMDPLMSSIVRVVTDIIFVSGGFDRKTREERESFETDVERSIGREASELARTMLVESWTTIIGSTHPRANPVDAGFDPDVMASISFADWVERLARSAQATEVKRLLETGMPRDVAERIITSSAEFARTASASYKELEKYVEKYGSAEDGLKAHINTIGHYILDVVTRVQESGVAALMSGIADSAIEELAAQVEAKVKGRYRQYFVRALADIIYRTGQISTRLIDTDRIVQRAYQDAIVSVETVARAVLSWRKKQAEAGKLEDARRSLARNMARLIVERVLFPTIAAKPAGPISQIERAIRIRDRDIRVRVNRPEAIRNLFAYMMNSALAACASHGLIEVEVFRKLLIQEEDFQKKDSRDIVRDKVENILLLDTDGRLVAWTAIVSALCLGHHLESPKGAV